MKKYLWILSAALKISLDFSIGYGASAAPYYDEPPLFYTARLQSLPPTTERIKAMAALLNDRTKGGELNSKYYEDGTEKDESWIQQKIEEILPPSSTKPDAKYMFFYTKEDPINLVCFVGRGMFNKKENSIFYATSPAFQGQKYTSEALQAFLRADAVFIELCCTSLVFSIHPDNAPSIRVAEKVGAIFLRRGKNPSKTQDRHVYALPKEKLLEQFYEFPSLEMHFSITVDGERYRKTAEKLCAIPLTDHTYSVDMNKMITRLDLTNFPLPYLYEQFLPWHTFLYKMVHDIDDVFTRMKTRYCVFAGMSLGMTRHTVGQKQGGCLPWDDDADLLSLVSDRSKVEACLKELTKLGYTYCRSEEKLGMDCFRGWKIESPLSFGGKCPFTDIFEIDIDPTDDDLYVFPPAKWTLKHKIKKTDLFPIVRRRLGGKLVNTPANPEGLLEAEYGKTWSQKYKRTSHEFDFKEKNFYPFEEATKLSVPFFPEK